MLKAVVLCGGKGTRLRPYTHSVPKSMLLLGRKPILEYAIEHLAREKITDLILTVGHLKEQIIDYFGDGKKFGVKIKYSVEEDELGTAGSVKNARSLVPDETFLVLMGDQLTNLSYRKVIDFHLKKKALATVALKRMGLPLQVGVAKLGLNDKVVSFKEKPIVQHLANAAIYVFNKKIWSYLPERGDFAFNVVPKLVADRKLYGFVFDDYWIDVGYIHEYEKINQAISLMDLILDGEKKK